MLFKTTEICYSLSHPTYFGYIYGKKKCIKSTAKNRNQLSDNSCYILNVDIFYTFTVYVNRYIFHLQPFEVYHQKERICYIQILIPNAYSTCIVFGDIVVTFHRKFNYNGCSRLD